MTTSNVNNTGKCKLISAFKIVLAHAENEAKKRLLSPFYDRLCADLRKELDRLELD